MPRIEPGSKVLITEDCRENGGATGQTGTYEGEFPLTIALTNDGGKTWSPDEYDYEAFAASEHVKEWPLWAGGEKPGEKYALVMTNPRIRLDDGSVIWGCQCWWCSVPADGEISLEKAQEQTEHTKEVLRCAITSLAEYMEERE